MTSAMKVFSSCIYQEFHTMVSYCEANKVASLTSSGLFSLTVRFSSIFQALHAKMRGDITTTTTQ